MSSATATTGTDTAPQRRISGEVWGALAAMLVVLPSAIAYGIAVYSVMGPASVAQGVRAGILGAIAIGIVAPLLGGAPRLISAPSAPAAAVLSALALELFNSQGQANPGKVAVLLSLTALMAGGLQIIYGLIGGGRLIKFIPYPVVAGYLSGVGLLIVIGQSPNFVGVPGSFKAAMSAPDLWSWHSIAVGLATVLGVLLAPRLTKAVPATIFGLICGTAAYFTIGCFNPQMLQLSNNPLVIGPIQSQGGSVFAGIGGYWSAITEARLSDLTALIMPALTLSVLLSIDTLKTCVVLDTRTLTRHNSNRELVGQGAGNLASTLIGGMPGSGAIGPTMINFQSGGTTRLSGVLEGVFVLAAFLLLSRWIAWVPMAALAGILIVVAFRMFDWKSFYLLRSRSTLLDFCVIGAVVFVAVKVSLMAAAGTGVALAVALFVRDQIRTPVIRRKIRGSHIFSTQYRLPQQQKLLAKFGDRTTVCDLQGNLFFGTTDRVLTELQADLEQCRYLILDMRRVQSIDYTAVHMLEQFEAILDSHGGFLLFSHLPMSLPTGKDLRAYFEQVGIDKPKSNVRTFQTLDDALRWAEDRILAENGALSSTADKPLSLDQIELFREVRTDAAFPALASCMTERTYAVGDSVFTAGGPGDELFFIRQGSVRISLALNAGKYHNLASFGRGDFFGELSFLDGGMRSANAIAAEPLSVFVITRSRFHDIFYSNPQLGLKILGSLSRALAMRLRRADSELHALHEI